MHWECHKVQEKTFQKPFLTSPSPWGSAQTPPKLKGSPLSKVKIENHRIVPFDSPNAAQTTTRTHFDGPFLKK